MTIMATINRAKEEFMSRTGQTPTHILLSPEMSNVVDEAVDKLAIYKYKGIRKTGHQILGLDVLFVDNIKEVRVALL